MIYYLALTLLLFPMMIFFPTRVRGRKNVPKKGRMILVANHQTNFDAILVGSRVLTRRFWFMAKSELFKNKMLGLFYKALDMYPVNRKKNDIQAVKKTLKLLNNEKALCIFPEGTRLETDEVNEIKNGVALFALKTKSPIVPSIFIKKPRFFRFNTYIIGEPFVLSDMPEFKDKPINKESLTLASAIISYRMNILKEEYLANKLDKKNRKRKKYIKNTTMWYSGVFLFVFVFNFFVSNFKLLFYCFWRNNYF